MTTRIYFVHALSPLHAGTGQGSGVIDLPIAREKATGLPYLPGSSVKGVLRDRSAKTDPLTKALFGPDTANASDHAGSLKLADARLLLLPVRSLRGTFAWVTSPYILRRFARDARDAGRNGLPEVPEVNDEECDVRAESVLRLQQPNMVILEDLDLAPQHQQAESWAGWLKDELFPTNDTTWPELLPPRFCIVSDNVMTFLLSTAIEVIARNRLDDQTKTVVKGQLWYEEALPAESILYGLAKLSPTDTVRRSYADATLTEHLNRLAMGAMQFGGKATIGRGLCRLRLS
jgi:CRISPR-associated protein Cmr4